MPGGLRLLSPAPIDGNARLMERLLSLEQRMDAVETKRDMIFTPFHSTGGNFTYTWSGGRVWLLVGGTGTGPSDQQFYGATVKVNTFTTAISQGVSSGAGLPATLPLTVVEVPLSYFVGGANTVNVSVASGTSVDVYGMFIEWAVA